MAVRVTYSGATYSWPTLPWATDTLIYQHTELPKLGFTWHTELPDTLIYLHTELPKLGFTGHTELPDTLSYPYTENKVTKIVIYLTRRVNWQIQFTEHTEWPEINSKG